MAIDPGQVERAVLEKVLELRPDHLTAAELVLKMGGKAEEDDAVRNAIHDLEGAGVLRCIGDMVAPTHAALHTATLLLRP